MSSVSGLRACLIQRLLRVSEMENERLIAMRVLRDIRKSMYENVDIFGHDTLCIRTDDFLRIVDKYDKKEKENV